MLFYEDDRTYLSYYQEEDSNSLSMNYTNNGIVMYQSIYRADDEGSSLPLLYTNETKRYINMRYAYVTNNWSLKDGAEAYGITHKYYDAVQCDKYHFMDNSTGDMKFKNGWN